MKAAVLRSFGEPPRYEEFPTPVAGPGEALVHVRACALTRLTRSMADGAHYTAPSALPAVVGADGIGSLPDGQRVYTGDCRPPYGMMAEWTVVPRSRCVPVPEGIDDLTAATLPNAAISSWFALVYRARLAKGETVLILGATGVAGKLAVSIAKHLGARKVVAAGRDEAVLRSLPAIGADAVVSLRSSDPNLSATLRREAGDGPFDVVLDYLWGHSAEIYLDLMTGHGPAQVVHRSRFVSIGSMASPTASVPSAALRSSGLEILGSGIGSVPISAFAESLPEIWSLAARGILVVDTERVPLQEVTAAWGRAEPKGRRIVVVP